jgi:[NiFe] hydrogenase diaphorase moiety large subunit
MLDIMRDVQNQFRCISPATMQTVATNTGLSQVAVEGVASFYAFLSLTPKSRVTIRR